MTTEQRLDRLEEDLGEEAKILVVQDDELRHMGILLSRVVDCLLDKESGGEMEAKLSHPLRDKLKTAVAEYTATKGAREEAVSSRREYQKRRIPTRRTSTPGVNVKRNGGLTHDSFEPGM